MRLKYVVFLATFAAIPGVATVVCPNAGTYQDLINSNGAGGCTISPLTGGVLTFSNFNYAPSGSGTPTAAQMGFFLDNPASGVGGQLIYGFEFNPGLFVAGTTGTPNSIQDVLLSYKVVATGRTITSVHLLENAAVTGSGVAQVSENLQFCTAADPDPTLGTCRFFGGNPLLVTTTGGAATLHNELLNLGNWTSMTVSKDIVAASVTSGSTAAISQVRDSVDLNNVPEPATYGAMGLGLLVLGYLGKRRRA